jgi:outer membrane protein assembly factor BamA
MMRKLLLIALALLVSGSVALAQSKVDTKWHCSKAAAEHKLDIGDAPDHSYWIGQGTCEAASSSGDLKEKTGLYTEFHDQWKASFNFHGHFNATTDTGDKVYYTYEGSASTDIAKPAANKWKIVGGTGKHKGTKGTGSCSGKVNADGSADWECTGTYSMGM